MTILSSRSIRDRDTKGRGEKSSVSDWLWLLDILLYRVAIMLVNSTIEE